MNKIQLALLLSCTLSALLYSLVRFQRDGPFPPPPPPSPTLPSATLAECAGQSPYALVSTSPTTFSLCGGGRQSDVALTCPQRTVFQPASQQCEPVDACYDQGDDTLVEASDAVHLPKNRRYHVCRNNRIQETRVCPDDTPFFDGQRCRASDACTFLEEGARFSDPQNDTHYYECVNREAVLHWCPEGSYFKLNQCVVRDPCTHQEDQERLPDSDDPSSYIRCKQKRAIKRRCPDHQLFSPVKKACVSYNRCLGKPKRTLRQESPFLLRTSIAWHCDEHEQMTQTLCEQPQHVYDEMEEQCRLLDLCRDVKPGKVYPVSDRAYLSCAYPLEPVLIDLTLTLDPLTADMRDRCLGRPDETVLGPYKTDSPHYVVCRGQRSEVVSCPEGHLFIDGQCQFTPCQTDPGRYRVEPMPQDPRAFFYCRTGQTHTFQVTCPPGTRFGQTRCEADPEYTPPPHQFNPILLDPLSYTDAQQQTVTCPPTRSDPIHGDIPGAVNPWIYQCQDRPCISVSRHAEAFAPITERTGVYCQDGRVTRSVTCDPPNYFNFAKTTRGDPSLPDCVPQQPPSKLSKIYARGSPSTFTYIRLGYHYGIEHDDFQHVAKLRQKSEPVYEGLEVVVGKLPPNPKRKSFKCQGTSTRSDVPGYPHEFVQCKTKEWDTCDGNDVSVGWKCGNILYPVFSDCGLFAVGRARTSINHRIFQCPQTRPIYNYLLRKCEANPPRSHLLCEDAFFENIQYYVDPHTLRLPDPLTTPL